MNILYIHQKKKKKISKQQDKMTWSLSYDSGLE